MSPAVDALIVVTCLLLLAMAVRDDRRRTDAYRRFEDLADDIGRHAAEHDDCPHANLPPGSA